MVQGEDFLVDAPLSSMLFSLVMTYWWLECFGREGLPHWEQSIAIDRLTSQMRKAVAVV
jgi:hypothetical protein